MDSMSRRALWQHHGDSDVEHAALDAVADLWFLEKSQELLLSIVERTGGMEDPCPGCQCATCQILRDMNVFNKPAGRRGVEDA